MFSFSNLLIAGSIACGFNVVRVLDGILAPRPTDETAIRTGVSSKQTFVEVVLAVVYALAASTYGIAALLNDYTVHMNAMLLFADATVVVSVA